MTTLTLGRDRHDRCQHGRRAHQVHAGQRHHGAVQRPSQQPRGSGQDHVQGARPHQRSDLPQNQDEGEEVLLEYNVLNEFNVYRNTR